MLFRTITLFSLILAFTSVANADSHTSVDKINAVLDEILTPVQDEILNKLSLQLLPEQTDFEQPSLGLHGEIGLTKTIWDPEGGAQLSVDLVAKGAMMEGHSKYDASSQFAMEAKLNTNTLAMIRHGSKMAFEKECSFETISETEDPFDHDALVLICGMLEQTQTVTSIAKLAHIVIPTVAKFKLLLEQHEKTEQLKYLKWHLEFSGSEKESSLAFYAKVDTEKFEGEEMDWLKMAALKLELTENVGSMAFNVLVAHDSKYLDKAKEELKDIADKITSLTDEEKAKISEKVKAKAEELKKVIVEGENLDDVLDLVLGLWLPLS